MVPLSEVTVGVGKRGPVLNLEPQTVDHCYSRVSVSRETPSAVSVEIPV